MIPGEATSFEVITEREKGLHRALSSRQLSMIAIGGAIGTGLFLGSSFAIGFAGPAVLLSSLIGALIAFLFMGCMAEMTVATQLRDPSAPEPSSISLHSPAFWCASPIGPASSSLSAQRLPLLPSICSTGFPSVPGWLFSGNG
jgi:amino acid transporter, AAT family